MAARALTQELIESTSKAFSKIFKSSSDDAARAATHFLSNSSDEAVEFFSKQNNRKGAGRLQDIIDFDVKGGNFDLTDPNAMFNYVGMSGNRATTGFSNADDFAKIKTSYTQKLNAERAAKNAKRSAKAKPQASNSQSFTDDIYNEANDGFTESSETSTQPQPRKQIFGSTDEMKKGKYKYESKQNYATASEAQRLEPGVRSFKDGNYDNEMLQEFAKEAGVDVKDLTEDQMMAARDTMLKKARNTDLTLSQQMGYHKVPQKAVGMAGSAWVINNLLFGGNKGQQSNSQLYNPQGPNGNGGGYY